jgi:hypothetical protein
VTRPVSPRVRFRRAAEPLPNPPPEKIPFTIKTYHFAARKLGGHTPRKKTLTRHFNNLSKKTKLLQTCDWQYEQRK